MKAEPKKSPRKGASPDLKTPRKNLSWKGIVLEPTFDNGYEEVQQDRFLGAGESVWRQTMWEPLGIQDHGGNLIRR